jgi:tryptophanyl-tRNA synthetase
MALTLERFEGAQFSTFKGELADLAVAKLGPIGEEMQRLMADPGHVDGILRDGAARANAIAEPVLHEVHEIVGFLNP